MARKSIYVNGWAYCATFIIIYTLFVSYLLTGTLYEYCVESASMTPFYLNAVFVHDTVTNPWGLFVFLSEGLMASFSTPWIGTAIYILLGIVLAALIACSVAPKGALRNPHPMSGIALCVPVLLLIPFVSGGYTIFTNKQHGDEFAWLFLLLVVFAVLAVLRRFLPMKSLSMPIGRVMSGIISFVVLLAAMFYTYSETCRDENFTAIITMKHAIERGDYNAVLEEAAKHPEPTRLQVMFTRLALFATGQSGEATYTYPDGDAPYDTEQASLMTRVIGATLLYYNYGKLNYAYRWAMEDMVEYGERPAYIIYMYKIAVMNGENELAARYTETLRTSPFYRNAAHIPDAERVRIGLLTNYTNSLEGDRTLIERYLLDGFVATVGGNEQMQQLTLDASLVLKDIPTFWPVFANLAKRCISDNTRIPRHYQEAALLFSRLRGTPDLTGLPLDPAICQQFEELVAASAANSHMGEDYNASALRPRFGGTYWYYYFFVNDLKAR